jgi:hypothetical protein
LMFLIYFLMDLLIQEKNGWQMISESKSQS